MELPLRTQSVAIWALALSAMGALAGCGKNTVNGCDPSSCKSGTQCLSDGTSTACRQPCNSQTECGVNAQCVTYSTTSFCVTNTTQIVPKTGQWGYPCSPGKVQSNPACDSSQGFGCYGASPTDANAYCTLYGCKQDLDCAGGYYCATVNQAPNVATATRSFNQTQQVCVRRSYCAPCSSDFDCANVGNTAEHCVQDITGAKYCATECKKDSECPLWAACFNANAPTTVCVPYAGMCKGDGGFCAPCRSDGDCSDAGVCAMASYSTEQFCTVPSGIPCSIADDAGGISEDAAADHLIDQCPSPGTANWKDVGCVYEAFDAEAPAADFAPLNQCFGAVMFAGNPVPGCWTRNR